MIQDVVTKIPRQVHLDHGALLHLVLRTGIRIRKSVFCEGGQEMRSNTVGINMIELPTSVYFGFLHFKFYAVASLPLCSHSWFSCKHETAWSGQPKLAHKAGRLRMVRSVSFLLNSAPFPPWWHFELGEWIRLAAWTTARKSTRIGPLRSLFCAV